MMEVKGRKIGILHYSQSEATVAAYEDNGTIHVGVSITGHGDQWNRKLGRTIAIGRLFCERPDTRGRYTVFNAGFFEKGKFDWNKLVTAVILSKPAETPDRFLDRLDQAMMIGA